ncbi:MAG: hypothetical protein AAGA66_09865 [Bacteroidota bacterium]
MRFSKQLIIAFLLLFLALIISNPSERRYLNRVSKDYGMSHHGVDLNPKSLLRMGESDRTNYLLFSRYTYQFGDISVSYVGLCTFVFFVSSSSHGSSGKRTEEIIV